MRADHFYNLYYEAHGLPQDITLTRALEVSATSNGGDALLTADGACRADSLWEAAGPGEQSVTYSPGADYEINKVTVYHAGAAGLDAALNTAAFRVEISEDGTNWTKAAEVKGNREDSSTVAFPPVRGAFVRITVTNPGRDGVARIADVDIFGNKDVEHVRCPQCGKIHRENAVDRFIGLIHRLLYLLSHLPSPRNAVC